MFATIRRYESIDEARISELVKKTDETFLPSLTELPGFSGYSLVEAGNGVMSSISYFDTSEHADESTRLASNWVREQKLENGAERAEDHQRRGRRAQDGRARPGVSLEAVRCQREGPRPRAFSRPDGRAAARRAQRPRSRASRLSAREISDGSLRFSSASIRPPSRTESR